MKKGNGQNKKLETPSIMRQRIILLNRMSKLGSISSQINKMDPKYLGSKMKPRENIKKSFEAKQSFVKSIQISKLLPKR